MSNSIKFAGYFIGFLINLFALFYGIDGITTSGEWYYWPLSLMWLLGTIGCGVGMNEAANHEDEPIDNRLSEIDYRTKWLLHHTPLQKFTSHPRTYKRLNRKP